MELTSEKLFEFDKSYNKTIIGTREEYENSDYQDEVEANSLYELLEKEVSRTFYDLSSDNLPRKWIGMMKNSMRECNAVFNTNRMVAEYTDRFYVPCDKHYQELSENNRQRARELAAWLDAVRKEWGNVQILDVNTETNGEQRVGDTLNVNVKIKLAGLDSDDVVAQAFYGQMISTEDLPQGEIVDLKFDSKDGDVATFKGGIKLSSSGKMGLAIRVLPSHKDLIHPLLTGHIIWAK